MTNSDKKGNNNEPHPTLFVWQGGIVWYEEGSMLELHTQITSEEWDMIVRDTIKYKVFIECLKEIACPILEDPWSKEDEWCLFQMNVAISRMRNIDALLVAGHNQAEIKEEYSKAMRQNAPSVKQQMQEIKKAQLDLHDEIPSGNGKDMRVSDL